MRIIGGIQVTTLEDIKMQWGRHPVPPMLADLCNYWDENPQFFAGSFEVEADRYGTLMAWFQGKEEGYTRVLAFGVDGIGSIFGLWLYGDRLPANAPIIFLGGEGAGNTLFANNFSEFFSLLAANRDWEPFDREFLPEPEDNREANRKFRAWVKKKWGIIPAADPMRVVRAAHQKHPDLGEWISKLRSE